MIKLIPIVLILASVISTLAPAKDLRVDIRHIHASSVPRPNADMYNAIQTIAKQNGVPNATINEQAKEIASLKARLEKKQSEHMREFTYAVLINIAAGVLASMVFWLFFVYFPEKHRRDKLRPKLDLGIYQVYRTLFAMFDSIMRFNANSPSAFQKKINGNKLSPEDIELGLQNKCLNETFLYDQNVSRSLMVIGKELFEKASEIDEATERVFQFNDYLTPHEILLLEQIRGKLHVYNLKSFDRPAGVRDVQHLPVDPSLSYMKENFAQLYELFCELRTAVFKNDYEDRDVLLDKIRCYFEQGDYGRCSRLIRVAQAKNPTDSTWLEFYLVLCEYIGGNKASAYQRLEGVLKGKPPLVSSRGFLLEVMTDRSIRQIVDKHYTKAEIDDFYFVVREETKVHTSFIAQANRLKEYYQQKVNSRLSKKSE